MLCIRNILKIYSLRFILCSVPTNAQPLIIFSELRPLFFFIAISALADYLFRQPMGTSTSKYAWFYSIETPFWFSSWKNQTNEYCYWLIYSFRERLVILFIYSSLGKKNVLATSNIGNGLWELVNGSSTSSSTFNILMFIVYHIASFISPKLWFEHRNQL